MDQPTWFKSTYSSDNSQCVKCTHTRDDGMAVRDSQHPATQPCRSPEA